MYDFIQHTYVSLYDKDKQFIKEIKLIDVFSDDVERRVQIEMDINPSIVSYEYKNEMERIIHN